MAAPTYSKLGNNGVLGGAGTIVRSGNVLTATPATGYKIDKIVVYDYYIRLPGQSGTWRYRESSSSPYTMPAFSWNSSGAGTTGTTQVEYGVYFVLKTYTIKVAKTGGTGSATVKIDGSDTNKTKTHGDTYDIEASWGDTDRFVDWSDNDVNPVRTGIVATDNITHTARFSNVKVSVRSSNIYHGTVSMTTSKLSGITSSFVHDDESVLMKATVTDPEYKFIRWTYAGVQVSTNAEYTLSSHTGNKEYIAVFEKIGSVTVTKNIENGNIATVNGQASVIADDNVMVLLEATPNAPSYVFVEWVDSNNVQISTQASAYMIVDSDSKRNVKAIFATTDKKITLTVDDPFWGNATIKVGESDKGKSYNLPKNTSCTLVASAVEFGAFGGWEIGGSIVEYGDELKVVWNNNTPVEIKALFDEAQLYDFTLEAKLSSDDDAVGCSLDVASKSEQESAPPGQRYGGPVEVTATAADGMHLAVLDMTVDETPVTTIEKDVQPSIQTLQEWGLPTDWTWGAPLVFKVKGDTVLKGTFAPNLYAVDVGVDNESAHRDCVVDVFWGPDEGSTNTPYDGSEILPYGSFLRMQGYSNDGDNFAGWFEDGQRIDNNSDAITVAVKGATSYKVKFGNTVTLSVKDSGPGTVAGRVLPNGAPSSSVDFVYGDVVEIVATPDQDKLFRGWEIDNKFQYGMPSTHSFKPNAPAAFSAIFADTATKTIVKLTNGENKGYGRLTITPVGDITKTDLGGEEEWEAALDEATGLTSGNGVLDLDGLPDGVDSFWELSDIGEVSINVEPLASNAVFAGWEVSYIEIDGGEYSFPAGSFLSASLTETLFVSDHCIIKALWETSEPRKVTVGYEGSGSPERGTIALAPKGDRWQSGPPIQGDYVPKTVLTATAMPHNGYRFEGWFSAASGGMWISDNLAFTFEVPSESFSIYARFVQDVDAIYIWEGSALPKWLTWRSKRFVLPKPANMAAVRVYADDYPVNAGVYTSSSPGAPVEQGVHVELPLELQDARRLPRMRPEKYIEVEVQSRTGIQEVATSTSMEGLV